VRVIVEAFGRAWMLTLQGAKIVTPGEVEDDEFEQAPPIDPHGTGGCQVERGPGADAFTSDVVNRRFGFHGSEIEGTG